jgi:hypothetical protein
MSLVLQVINVPDANVKPGSPIMPWLVKSTPVCYNSGSETPSCSLRQASSLQPAFLLHES